MYTHFGNISTSKLEGAHALLKSYLRHSRGDLFTVIYNMARYVDGLLSQTRTRLAQLRSRPPNSVKASKIPFLRSDLNFFIVPHAITLLIVQWRRAEEMAEVGQHLRSQCTGLFEKVYGIPCWHSILATLSLNYIFSEIDFHPY